MSGSEQQGRIVCVGVGNVGRAWAVAFARGGHEVVLHDREPARVDDALRAIAANLADLEAAGHIADAAVLRRRISFEGDLARAVAGAAYIQESVPEQLDCKRAVFRDLDALVDAATILASSTSEIAGSRIFAQLPGRHRCLVAHPLNPPSLIPLVELCPAPQTAPQVVERTRRLFLEMGHRPILVRKEISGFIANRLQIALLAEALHLVGEGHCEPADIDAAMVHGLALRWVVIGPFETGHLNASAGYKSYLELYGDTHRAIQADLRVDYAWSDALVDRIHDTLCQATPVGKVPERQAWRDRRLMGLLRHLAEEEGRQA